MASGLDSAQIVKLIRGAKPDAALAFAFASGATPDKCVLVVEKQKTPEQLLAVARKEGGSKACCGTVFSEGSEATFQTDSPLPGLNKQLNEWFKHNKQSLKSKVEGSAAAIPEAPPAKDAGKDEDDEEGDDDEGPILFQEETVRRMLRRARKKPMNFAFGLSNKADSHALAIHPRKKPAQLAMLAKRESGSSRGGFGTVTAEGERLVEFHCEKNPPGGTRKAIRALFKSWGLKSQVRVYGPEGELDEADDGDDAAEGAGAPTDAAAGGDEATLAALRGRLAVLFPMLKRIADSDPGRADTARAGYRECDAAVKAGDVPVATRTLEALERLVGPGAANGGAAEGASGIAALRAELERLLPALKEAAKLPDRAAPVRDQWKTADTALTAGNEGAASSAMEQLRRLAVLPGAGGAGNLDAARAAWAETREAWQDASEAVDRQISALQTVLRASDDEDLEEIAERGLNGVTGNFRVPMMAAVADLDRAAGEAFRAAAAKALRNIEAFQKHIETDERVEAVDDNPFGVKVSIRDTLGGALTQMRSVLSMATA